MALALSRWDSEPSWKWSRSGDRVRGQVSSGSEEMPWELFPRWGRVAILVGTP